MEEVVGSIPTRSTIFNYLPIPRFSVWCSCHGSTAAQHLGGKNADYELIASMKQNYEATAISSKMKAWLAIGGSFEPHSIFSLTQTRCPPPSPGGGRGFESRPSRHNIS